MASAPAPTDLLRTELERLFDLEQMQRLSSELLGLDPHDVGGTTGKAPFARALVERCTRDEMLEALADAITLHDRGAEPRLRPVYDHRAGDEIAVGTTVGSGKIQRRASDDAQGVTYAATGEGGQAVSVRVLRGEPGRDRRATQRFVLAWRAMRAVEHPSVQRVLDAGLLADGRVFVVTEALDGQSLASRLGRTGAMHVNEARPVLESIAAGLERIHAAGISHADLRTDHVVLVRRDGQLSGVLVDFAGEPARGTAVLAPERARSGGASDARSDVYALGAVAFEMLSGKPPFAGATPVDVLVAHVTQTPDAPSKVAPRGWVSPEVDAVVLKALAKSPDERFESAASFVRALKDAARSRRAEGAADDLSQRGEAVLADPSDDEKALALERAGEATGAWSDVLATFEEARTKSEKPSVQRALLFRAARIAQMELADLPRAKSIYDQLLALDDRDEIARAKLLEVRRLLATPEERAEILLEEAERETLGDKKADIFRELAALYEQTLHDTDNAVVAAVEALAAAPARDDLARDLERLCRDDVSRWNEALQLVSQSATDRDPLDGARLLLRAGQWYGAFARRPDFAIACFTKALTLDAGNDEALAGASEVYRRAQQWAELAAVLLKRADAQTAPARARNLRAEAADVIESRLGDVARARTLLDEVIEQDAGNALAGRVLERIHTGADDWASLAALHEKRAGSLAGSAQAEALLAAAETYEVHLRDDAKAAAALDRARAADARNVTVLKALERMHARNGRIEPLLSVLLAQLDVAVTPRQKVDLWNRIGAIYEEEFVDAPRASEAFGHALAIDPTSETALTATARLLRAAAKWDDLVALLDRHASLVDDPRRKADLLVARGRILLDPLGAVDRAGQAFDKALATLPTHPGALEEAARLRSRRGDARAAAEALDALAAQAATPAEKADALHRAGRILEERGDRDAAVDRYKRALDAVASHAPSLSSLRDLYAQRGDVASATDLLQREIEAADGVHARSRAFTQIARLHRGRGGDATRAHDAAEKALALDPGNAEASAVLGEIAFEAGDYTTAAKLLAPRGSHATEVGGADGLQLALRLGEALARTGDLDGAVAAFEQARTIAPDDRGALLAIGRAHFDLGQWARARERFAEMLARFGRELTPAERASALSGLGISALRLGDAAGAAEALRGAVQADPTDDAALEALVTAEGGRERWRDAAGALEKRVALATGDARAERQVELGELLATRLDDVAGATRAYVAALEARPDDRRLLGRLMQLYSEGRDWQRLVDVVLRLAEHVQDGPQRSKYLATAAQLAARELHDPAHATEYGIDALEADPDNARAVSILRAIATTDADREPVAAALGAAAERTGIAPALASRLNELLGGVLAPLAAKNADALARSAAAYERARSLDPSLDVGEKLAELYLRDGKKNPDRAVKAQRELLARDPLRTESYKALTKLYTQARRIDEAWCSCQALVALRAAEPDQESFFKRLRSEVPLGDEASALDDDLWSQYLAHPTLDPVLTGLFAAIAPAVLAARAQAPAAYGVAALDTIDLSEDPAASARVLRGSARVLGIPLPTAYGKPADASGFTVMHTARPAVLIGGAALKGGPSQALAFLAGHTLTAFRPGYLVRHVVPTGTGLRGWLFAAIRLGHPSFPVSPEIAGLVDENVSALRPHVTGAAREQISSLASRLLGTSGALDLRRWTTAVDLTADRAGFLVSNDLPRALAVVRATPDDSALLPARDRLRELQSFSISEGYLDLRRRLGIALRPAGA